MREGTRRSSTCRLLCYLFLQICTKFIQIWHEYLKEQRQLGSTKDYHHGGQGGPRERGLEGALHVGYYAICFPKYAPNSTKFGMSTEKDKDNWDQPRTTIMETKGDIENDAYLGN